MVVAQDFTLKYLANTGVEKKVLSLFGMMQCIGMKTQWNSSMVMIEQSEII